jgi:hypothetical protein
MSRSISAPLIPPKAYQALVSKFVENSPSATRKPHPEAPQNQPSQHQQQAI